MDTKPVNWSGTREDQLELFIEILAYLLAREILDQNRRCMSCENFVRLSHKLVDREAYYDKALKHFNKMLTTWRIKYNSKTGIKSRTLDLGTLLLKAYRARIRAILPDGKVKKYTDVYEELE
jgi:hypothetical protein